MRLNLEILARRIEDNDLSNEPVRIGGWVVVEVRSDVATFDIPDRQILDIESNQVTGSTPDNLLVMNLNGLDL